MSQHDKKKNVAQQQSPYVEMGTPQGFGSESTAPMAKQEMSDTRDTTQDGFKEQQHNKRNRNDTNTLSVDEIMGSQDTGFPQTFDQQQQNTQMNAMVKSYKMNPDVTRPDKRKASQGLKMYIGKNQTINMSRHKQVQHILSDWYKSQNMKVPPSTYLDRDESLLTDHKSSGVGSLPNLKQYRDRSNVKDNQINNRYSSKGIIKMEPLNRSQNEGLYIQYKGHSNRQVNQSSITSAKASGESLPLVAYKSAANVDKQNETFLPLMNNSSQDQIKYRIKRKHDIGSMDDRSLERKHSISQIQPKQGHLHHQNSQQRMDDFQNKQQHQTIDQTRAHIDKSNMKMNDQMRGSINQPRSEVHSIFSKQDEQLNSNRKLNTNFQSITSINKPKDLFPFLDENIAQVHLNKITGNITSGGLASSVEANDISHFIKTGVTVPQTRGDKILSQDIDHYVTKTDRIQSTDDEYKLVTTANNSMYSNNIQSRLNQKLVESSFGQKPDFRNPYLKLRSTFSRDPKRVNKLIFDKSYKMEFRGKDSPSPTNYLKNTINLVEKHESKTIPRDERVCQLVSKQNLELRKISPQYYQDLHTNSSFKIDFISKKNSQYFGSRAARNVDVQLFAQKHHNQVHRGIF